VLTSLMVAGRNSSGMASELGSMVVTEQIDAMRALGTDPMKKLVTPRVTSTVFMLFFLTIISDLVGLTGGLFIAKVLLRLDARQYWFNAWETLVFQDVFMGLLKPVLFGFCSNPGHGFVPHAIPDGRALFPLTYVRANLAARLRRRHNAGQFRTPPRV
jgi:ABC transport permease subunit